LRIHPDKLLSRLKDKPACWHCNGWTGLIFGWRNMANTNHLHGVNPLLRGPIYDEDILRYFADGGDDPIRARGELAALAWAEFQWLD
jgi:hypothetical protein